MEGKAYGTKTLSQLKPAVRKYILDRVMSVCPSMGHHEQEFDSVLSRILSQAKYYQSRGQKLKGSPRTSPKSPRKKGNKKKSSSGCDKKDKGKVSVSKHSPPKNVKRNLFPVKVYVIELVKVYLFMCVHSFICTNRVKLVAVAEAT